MKYKINIITKKKVQHKYFYYKSHKIFIASLHIKEKRDTAFWNSDTFF